jgi:hypothetical protein
MDNLQHIIHIKSDSNTGMRDYQMSITLIVGLFTLKDLFIRLLLPLKLLINFRPIFLS